MKSTRTKQSNMKRSLVLGATAVTAANTQAAIVYWDTRGLPGMTVSSQIDVDSYENLWIYYDSATQTIGQGGKYGWGARRGFNLQAKGTTGKNPGEGGNYLDVYPAGKSLSGLRVSTIVGKMAGGGVISAGTAIDGSSIDFDNGYSAYLFSGLTDFYVGIRLWEGNTDGEYNYGWASITTSADGTSATLNGVAFESEINTAINAGATETSAVPEPGNVVSLAVLLSSAALLRTRRKGVAA
jgi:hypothetical protein